ncbi:DapH/DapD/GlmU-related protein [Aurantimonas sp. C2-6-R+9]|uniref:N-acetyltransferase n=1 Tax=unclassified Aurantimonas TaxID=2638230 RepID=UPI002E173280|nr:DapH/DapD/GlmU-related protein [Aurantimonas sp. C2-6-R+9]
MTARGAHPSAVIDPGARIGDRTRIWHFSHICAGAVIGADCVLGQNVFIADGVQVGNRVRIQNNVSLYDGVVLEDQVFCGPSCVFTNVANPRAHVSRRGGYRRTIVRCGATIGANATIVCGREVGAYAFVAAGAVVVDDVAPHVLVMGVPARPAGFVSRAGERLGPDFVCPHDGSCYAFRSGVLVVLED